MHDHHAEEHDKAAAKAPLPGRSEQRAATPQVHAMLDLQRSVGNDVIQRRMRPPAEEQSEMDEQRALVDHAKSRAGEELDPAFRAEAEARTGKSFAGRRVHKDDSAHDAAVAVQARAFASGDDIFFAKGEYDTKTDAGKAVVLEELIHTDQQRKGDVAGTVQENNLKISSPHDKDETAAAREVAEAMGKPAPVQRNTGDSATGQGIAVQRASDSEHDSAQSGSSAYDSDESGNSEDLPPVERIRARAQRYAVAARRALNAIYNNREAQNLMVLYFGSGHSEDAIERIQDSYSAAENVLRTVVIKDWPNAPEGAHGKSRLGGSIKVAGLNSGGSVESLAFTVLHEATHVAEDTHDGSQEEGAGDSLREAAVDFARSNPGAAINCAHNLEYFAAAVNGRTFAPESDFESDGSGSGGATSSSEYTSSEMESGSDSEHSG
ncbi:eCIS core domain-containing protein [Amycolatopsis sp. CA-230715]|uniref:eCIS core domain-containing protein n=1 Tax=Amycolatopsis sp. CA-230715 TaxID=2745196 RepID=UPI001C01AF36|nr:DUF4157 domain-containing protein [Amycolatopsis sp. CA-230715]QWF77836.1 hypothetical protein HUW46_01229 [Amycolatopsis sp. CA-230715]